MLKHNDSIYFSIFQHDILKMNYADFTEQKNYRLYLMSDNKIIHSDRIFWSKKHQCFITEQIDNKPHCPRMLINTDTIDHCMIHAIMTGCDKITLQQTIDIFIYDYRSL
jgi:hypothetical protein